MIFLKNLIFISIIAHALCNTIENRIVGGVEAERGRFPFICGVQLDLWDGNFCGSSILTPDFVLTSAHCIIVPIIQYTVHCGMWNISVYDEHRQIRNIKEAHIHELFDDDNEDTILNYDIALLQLNASLVYTQHVQPINIIWPGYNRYNANLTVLGWGADSPMEETYPETLQVGYMRFITHEQCKAQDILIVNNVTIDNLFCAMPIVGASCGGDSGSPAVQPIAGNQYIQLGITTFGERPCGRPESIVGYIDLSLFNDWIKGIISNNTDNSVSAIV